MTAIGILLGSGKEADVHAFGDLALKLYKSPEVKALAFREAANLAILERLSLPVPRVHAVGRYEGRWGIVMDRVPGRSLGKRIEVEGLQPVVAEMTRFQQRMHGEPGVGLSSLKTRLASNIQKAPGLEEATRQRLLLKLAALPDGDRVCHGDFHPWNIHGSGRGAMILDWLDACCGHPLADTCRSYLLMLHAMPEAARTYLESYTGLSGCSDADILAWLPVVAAARLAEGVEKEQEKLMRLATADGG